MGAKAPAREWGLRPISSALGMEVSGVDLREVDGEQARQIASLFYERSALLFRDQTLEPEHLVRFSRHLGDLDEAPVNEGGKTAVEGYREIYVVSNILGRDGKPIGSLGAGEAAWHTDMSYLEKPPKASMLYAVEFRPQAEIPGLPACTRRLPACHPTCVAGSRAVASSTMARITRQGCCGRALRQAMTP